MKAKWYLAIVLVYPIIRTKRKVINNKNCVFWENYILIKSGNHELAYKKAFKYGKECEDCYQDKDGNFVNWKFAGIKDLIELLNVLDDEQELTYKQGFKKSFKAIQNMVPLKKDLNLFQYENFYKKNKKHDDNYILKHRLKN